MPFTKALDVIQQAQSGTGKTATFCAGILNNLDYNLPDCQALVLAPTRELAQQIEKVMRALGDFLQVGRAQGGPMPCWSVGSEAHVHARVVTKPRRTRAAAWQPGSLQLAAAAVRATRMQ